MRRKFVAAINIPSPYRVYLWGEVCSQLNTRGIDFELHIMSRGHKERPDSWRNPVIDYAHKYWEDYGIASHHFNPGMIRYLRNNPPEWLFCSSPYDSFTGACLMLLCKKSIRIAWQETNTKTPGKIDGLLGWYKRLVLTSAQFIGVPGSDAIKQMAMHQGRCKKKIPPCAILPNLVDESRFAPVSVKEKGVLKREMFALDPETKLCLIPARLTEVKGLGPFISLLSQEMLSGWKIIILGDGPLRGSLLAQIAQSKLDEHISIVESIDYAMMPKCYAAADIVLLPSLYDPNPLTCVEALHTGLPLALTCMAGNVEEAVTEGKNGWILPVKDRAAYRTKLKEVFSATRETLQEMGRCSLANNAQFWNTSSAIAMFLDQIGAK